MVSPITILILLATVAFFAFGGTTLLKPAFETLKEDFSELKTGVTEQVQNIKAKTEAGKAGETVG